jgi:lactate racemase
MNYKISEENNVIIFKDQYEKVKANIKKNNFAGLIKINDPKKLNWPNDTIYSLENPINSLPLHQLAKGAQKIVIIISDATRGVPTHLIFPFVIKELRDAGIGLKQINVVIALGVHRKSTVEEMRNMVGEEYFDKINIFNHDPYNKHHLVNLGETSYGTPLEINKIVFEADFRIIIGKVEPHEFAGFSGGRKSILPGVSSEKTIKINHRPEMIMNVDARPGSLDNNVIHLDMLEAAKLLKIHFSINFVLDSDGETVGLFSGDILSAHQEAVDFVKSFCEVRIKKIPDIIITTPGYPLNIDFYQSIKPLIALESICKKGTVIILYSSCPEGINSPDMVWPFENSENIKEVIKKLMNNYKIQMDHALLLTKIINKGINLIVYSPNVKASLLKKMYMEPAPGLQQAIEKAYKRLNKKDVNVLIYPQAQKTLPVLVKNI